MLRLHVIIAKNKIKTAAMEALNDSVKALEKFSYLKQVRLSRTTVSARSASSVIDWPIGKPRSGPKLGAPVHLI